MKFILTALRASVIAFGVIVLYSPFAFGQEKTVEAPWVNRAPLTVEEVEMLVSSHVHPDRIARIIRELGIAFPATDDTMKRFAVYGVPDVVTDTIRQVAIEQERRSAEQVEKRYGDGIEALRRHSFTEALASFKAVIQLKPDHAEAHFYGGYCYAALEDFDTAIRFYKQAVRLKPDYPNAFFRMGVAYDKLGRQEQAIEAYENVVRLRPADAAAYYNLGVANGKLGRHRTGHRSL